MINIKLDYVRITIFFKRTSLIFAVLSFAHNSFAIEKKSNEVSCEEILNALVTNNFDSVFEDSERHGALAMLSSIYGQRTATKQRAIDDKLTEDHLRKEMSFQVRNPTTGFYDKFVAVPVNGHVAPILKTDYDRMVRSTGPVLRALRSLLQKAFSHKDWTVESLGLADLPPNEADIVLKVLRESIYMEPALNAPQMADYPFLAVSGFDGAIVDPRKPQNVFFEMNLGTPSGLSNNSELLESLRSVDPEVVSALEPYMGRDNTYAILRNTIERNAAAWTRRSGLSVVISPGIYNGAHPDVAVIARKTGMPLVKSSDLYEDADGRIRLNTGIFEEDPIVTGIYNRMEESFFFQSSSENIPLISPQYTDVASLNAKTGLNLRPGAIYKWIYDPSGKISDVEKDADGKPILEEVWDTMGKDPSRPEAPRGSFARAVLNRQLYVSNVGGRLVDDKRLFRIVSRYLAVRVPGTKVASPVLGLSPQNLSALFRRPDDFVVKAPANSGGVGIHFLRTMTMEDKSALLEEVRRRPGEYEVQYVSPIATLPQASGEQFENVAIDLRIFVMMDPDGEVSAGSNSILLRTAPPGGLYSNTSRGGGYGIGVIISNTPAWWRRPVNDRNSYGLMPDSTSNNTFDTLDRLKDFHKELVKLPEGAINSEKLQDMRTQALALSFQLRDIMHLLKGSTLALPSNLRDFSENQSGDLLAIDKVIGHLEASFRSMSDGDSFIWRKFERMKRLDPAWWSGLKLRWDDPMSLSYSALNSKIIYRKLEEPVVAYYWIVGEERHEKYEMAEIVKVDDPVVQEMIDFVRANGGEVRMMKRRILLAESRNYLGWRYESPYFWVNLDPTSKSFLKPVIGIDLTGDRALAALAHEMQHFKIWLENYHLQMASGLDHEAAVRAAVDHVWQQDMIVYGERRAVEAEMQAERDYGANPFNQAQGMSRPTNYWEAGYINRITYPEYQAVRHLLNQHANHNKELDMETLRKYMGLMVQTTLDLRAKALDYLREHPSRQLEDYWRYHSISDLLLRPYGKERLREERTLLLFDAYLREICQEITGDQSLCF